MGKEAIVILFLAILSIGMARMLLFSDNTTVLAQTRLYHLNQEWVKIWINNDGSTDVFYNISITLDSGPEIHYVLVGQPKGDFSIAEATDEYGNSLATSDASSGSDYSVRVDLNSPLSSGQTIWFILLTNVAHMIYEDSQTTIALQFTPTWWSEAQILDLRVAVVIPLGIRPGQIQTNVNWDSLLGEPDGRWVVYWQRQNLAPDQKYTFIVSFPKQAEASESTSLIEVEWNRTYGGPNSDYANSVVQTSDRGYALAGTTWSLGEGNSDFWLVKVGQSGAMQWNKTYGTTNKYEHTTCMVQTSDDGYLLAGFKAPFITYAYYSWLVKVDVYGNMQWNRTSEGAEDRYAADSVILTTDGGYVLAGQYARASPLSTNAATDFWLLKLGAKPWLEVPYESQGNAAWCWAASTAMILRYYGTPYHVWDIGKTEPLNLFLGQIASYIKTTFGSRFETVIGSYPSISNQIRDDMISYLTEGYPVLLNVDPPGLGTHNVVVTGYNSSGFFINDPSGALFRALGKGNDYPFIQKFASWTELRSLIFAELITNDVFLVIQGSPSPMDATLFMTNGYGGTVATHDMDNSKGVCIDYGGWYWYEGLYWQTVGGHNIVLDTRDTLYASYEIFNHKMQEAKFDLNLYIKDSDGRLYYELTSPNILVPPLGATRSWDLQVALKKYLVGGREYTVTLKLYKSGSSVLVDQIMLPPISYGTKSIMFMTECPVRLLVTDLDGLRTGFDFVSNHTVNEIPGALYYYGNGSEPEIVSISNQKTGNYSVLVFGTESGTYNFTCATLNETGFLNIGKDINVYIEKDSSQTRAIPEFPSSLLLSALMIAITALVLVPKRKRTQTEKTRVLNPRHMEMSPTQSPFSVWKHRTFFYDR